MSIAAYAAVSESLRIAEEAVATLEGADAAASADSPALATLPEVPVKSPPTPPPPVAVSPPTQPTNIPSSAGANNAQESAVTPPPTVYHGAMSSKPSLPAKVTDGTNLSDRSPSLSVARSASPKVDASSANSTVSLNAPIVVDQSVLAALIAPSSDAHSASTNTVASFANPTISPETTNSGDSMEVDGADEEILTRRSRSALRVVSPEPPALPPTAPLPSPSPVNLTVAKKVTTKKGKKAEMQVNARKPAKKANKVVDSGQGEKEVKSRKPAKKVVEEVDDELDDEVDDEMDDGVEVVVEEKEEEVEDLWDAGMTGEGEDGDRDVQAAIALKRFDPENIEDTILEEKRQAAIAKKRFDPENIAETILEDKLIAIGGSEDEYEEDDDGERSVKEEADESAVAVGEQEKCDQEKKPVCAWILHFWFRVGDR